MLTATFTVEQGVVSVYLTDDIRSGDAISGPVVAIPLSSSTEQQVMNLAALRSLVIVGPPANPDAMAKAQVSSEMSDPSECQPGKNDWKAGEFAHAEALPGFPK